MDNAIKVLRQDETGKYAADWGELTWYAGADLGNSDDMTVGRCMLRPGQANPRHYHPNCSEVLVVWSGRISHTVGENEEVELVPGDTVTIPANVWHQARNVGDEDAHLMITFSSANRETVGETP